MVLQNISSNRLFFIVSISTALSTVLWTLSTSSTSTSTASTIALCTSILGYLLFQHQHRSLLNHRYQRRKQRDGTEDVSVILPDYISIERLGRVVSNREATPQAFGWRSSPPLSAITDSKSEPQQQPHSSSTPSNAPPFFTRQHQHGQNVRGNPDPEQLKQSQAMTNNSCSPLDVLTKETLEAIGAHLDYRIWDHIVVGGTAQSGLFDVVLSHGESKKTTDQTKKESHPHPCPHNSLFVFPACTIANSPRRIRGKGKT
jgi:hypothetical protein